jgi:DNA (cytosine-5)-methyltransferase 1
VDTAEELSTNQPANVISFCAGYGGIERGLDLAGINHRVIAYVEIEAFAIANLVAKMESGELDAAPVWTDLKTFPAHLFRDCVDIITGGYPCQPFSAAGKRKGEEDPRHLWPHIRRHVRTINPLQCFFENVEGHISLGLNSVISDLEEDGYDSTFGIFSAEEVGAHHQRKRIFILANSSSAGRQQITRSSHENESEHEGRSTVQTDITSSHGERNRERTMADSDNKRFGRWSKETRREERSSTERYSESNVADTTGIGVQGLRSGREQESYPHGQATLPVCQSKTSSPTDWLPEPNVGRVVDGCPDRVDRIRLLGNGVVPQTAAKAWTILNKRLEEI